MEECDSRQKHQNRIDGVAITGQGQGQVKGPRINDRVDGHRECIRAAAAEQEDDAAESAQSHANIKKQHVTEPGRARAE